MRAHLRSKTLLALGLVSAPAWAVDTTMAPAGFTGLGITPNAHLLGWGRAEAAYDRQLPGIVANPRGHNYVLGFGLLPNLEIAGRLATNTLDNNCFVAPGCGARDLSASGKLGIGLDARNRWRVAGGATDIGGSVTYFRAYYGVLTYNEGPFEASAGVAKRSGNGIAGSRSPLNGPFGSLAWQPLPLVRGHVEYTDGKAWAGVRLFAPDAWVPEGWSLSLGANTSLTNTNLTQRRWLTASLSIPLYKVPGLPGAPKSPLPAQPAGTQPLPAYEARALAPSATPLPQQPSASAASNAAPSVTAPAAPAATTAPADVQLAALADALQAKGLEDISVGRMPDSTVAVRANNGSYRWNAADAVGAALGAIARTLGDAKTGYRLIVTQRQMPLVGITGQADCLRQWIEQPSTTCTAGELSTPGSMALDPLHDGVVWVVHQQKPAWQTARVSVSPVLRTTVGTEFGAFDYAVGANVATELPLWSGASVDWGVNVPIANSDDFRPGAFFANRRIPPGTDRLTFTQTTRLPVERLLSPGQGLRWSPGALTAQATVGRVGSFYDGAMVALRWEPGEGRHRFSARGGRFDNNAYGNGFGPLGSLRRAAPLLGSYRYSFLPTRTDLEATAGQFLNNDRGYQFTMRQWFADTSVDLYYKRTSFPGERAAQLVGIQLTLPIGPRRDWQPLQHLQVGGSQRFAHSVETSIREKGGNAIRSGHAARFPAPDLNDYFNSDRAGLAWFEDNMRRVRDAAR